MFSYRNLYLKYTLMEKKKLRKETGCLDPCSYIEYKVLSCDKVVFLKNFRVRKKLFGYLDF